MFYRVTTDGRQRPVDLRNAYAGPMRSPCWLIGGGPSLSKLPTAAIAASPAPKFAINLAGHGLLRPDFWTSYDPTARFLRSIYLDASITKFVHRCRAMDLIPESTHKVCDAPSLYFLDRAPQRGFHDFPGGAPTSEPAESASSSAPANPAITDWQDSLIQAIDIAFHLGFRTLYLAGCEMFVRPAAEHIQLAASVGVDYLPRETLKHFFDRCRANGLANTELHRVSPSHQYHFSETKPTLSAIQTDFHYFRVAQYLRLARRSLALAGLELISVTPESRLNDYFPYRAIERALAEVLDAVGDPARETTAGLYTDRPERTPAALGPMRDFPPHNWPRKAASRATRPAQSSSRSRSSSRPAVVGRQRLRQAIEGLPEIAVDLRD